MTRLSNSLELAGVVLILLLNAALSEVDVDGFDEEFDLAVDDDPVLPAGVCLEVGCGVDVLAKKQNKNINTMSNGLTQFIMPYIE